MGVFDDLNHSTLYFSSLLGVKIQNQNNQVIGKLSDLFVDYENIYPEVLAVQFKKQAQYFYIHWEDIQSFSLRNITIGNDTPIRQGRTYPKVKHKKVLTGLLASPYNERTIDYPGIGKVILDRQVVDTHGKKVVRVNDIHFVRVGQQLRVTHAAAGFKSMVRRLGYDRFFNLISQTIPMTRSFINRDKVINWKCVHAIPDQSVQKDVKLNISDADLKGLHPADLADILEDLDNQGREKIFRNLEPELAAQTLSEIDQDVQTQLIAHEDPIRIARIVDNMDPDEAVDLLNEMDEEDVKKVLDRIEDNEHQEEIQELLSYDEESAGGLMSTEVLQVSPQTTRDQIFELIREDDDDLETVYDIYVVNENEHLIGTCSLRQLVRQRNNVVVADIMENQDIKSLPPSASWKQVASLMSKYNLNNVPILSEETELLGIISVDDILPWLLNER